MNQIRSKTKGTLKAIALITAVFIMGGISYSMGSTSSNKIYHKYVMRGMVLTAEGKEVYICIGSKDGALAGQKFDVYRLVAQGINQPGKGGVAGPVFRKEKTGTVTITQIVDEHFARATITSGAAQKNYIVELEFPVNCD